MRTCLLWEVSAAYLAKPDWRQPSHHVYDGSSRQPFRGESAVLHRISPRCHPRALVGPRSKETVRSVGLVVHSPASGRISFLSHSRLPNLLSPGQAGHCLAVSILSKAHLSLLLRSISRGFELCRVPGGLMSGDREAGADILMI
jgi:hypothetical protein